MCLLNILQAYILAPLQPGQEVYMNDPENPTGDTLLRLLKSLDGLKSSARNFNNHLHSWRTSKQVGFTRSSEDFGMYTRGVGKDRIVLLAYVDDLLSICSPETSEKWKREMDKAKGGHWDLRDYGEPKVFLACDIHRDLEAGTIHYSQHTYITNVAARFNLTNTVWALRSLDSLSCRS